MTPGVEIRLLREEDLDRVMAIERECFSLPWEREAFRQEIAENRAARYIGLFEEGRLSAYAGMWFLLDEAHVTNIAVTGARRGQGLGERLMRALIQTAADCGMAWMSLECRRSNAAAQALYHKLGFVDVGYRKRYYEDNQEDALVMALLSLPEGDPERDPFLRSED